MPTIRKQEGRLGRGQKESKEMLDDQTAERLPEGEKDTEPNSQSKQVADQASCRSTMTCNSSSIWLHTQKDYKVVLDLEGPFRLRQASLGLLPAQLFCLLAGGDCFQLVCEFQGHL